MKKEKAKNGHVSKNMPIEHAVALFLETRSVCRTAKQCLKELLEEVKKIFNNDKLTLQNLKKSLSKWFQEGWATVDKEYLQVTHAGRAKIKQLAEAAVQTPALATV